MALTADEILKIMERAKELGATTVNVEGLQVDFGVTKPAVSGEVKDGDEDYKPLSIFDGISDEEVLYWSSPYYDELQRIKQEVKQDTGKELVV